ncbi:MAG: MmgE/PrpD family protein [Pseudomonadota bacterium]
MAEGAAPGRGRACGPVPPASGGDISGKMKGGGAASGDPGRALTQFALRARVPEDVLELQRMCLFDWAVCAVAGAAEPVARVARAQVSAEGGAGQASVAGLAGMAVPARAAAFANGTVSHALDYDDTHFAHIGHPSVVVLPAVLAVAERAGAPAGAVLSAAIVGSEASVRVGQWLGESHAAAGFHTTATAGAIGAGLGVARLMGLSEAAVGHVLGLLSTRASGLRTQFGTMGKPLNAGFAAAAAVEAADLVAAGAVSAPGALAGSQGFGPAHRGAGHGEALTRLGTDWRMRTVTHKFHVCCHGLHAMLEALGGLQLAPAAIDRVTVRTHPRWRRVCDVAAPRTGLEAKFSYRMAAALALAGYDTAAPASFCDAHCSDPALTALRDKVDVVPDETLTRSAVEVEVSAAGGRAHRVRHDIATPLEAQVRRERLLRKAHALLGPETAGALAEAALAPEPDLPALMACLRAARA